jgi:hypothetical protein
MKKLIILSGPKASGKSHIIEAFKIISDGAIIHTSVDISNEKVNSILWPSKEKASLVIVEEFKDVALLFEVYELSLSLSPDAVHVFATQLDVFDHQVPEHLKHHVHIINCRNKTAAFKTCKNCGNEYPFFTGDPGSYCSADCFDKAVIPNAPWLKS